MSDEIVLVDKSSFSTVTTSADLEDFFSMALKQGSPQPTFHEKKKRSTFSQDQQQT